MKLTKEEKELILQKRKQAESNKPKFTGVLKHDLYWVDECGPEITIDITKVIVKNGWFLTSENLKELTKLFEKRIGKYIKIEKGSLFDCYIENGKESWYDSVSFGIESEDSDWARKNLEDIKEIK